MWNACLTTLRRQLRSPIDNTWDAQHCWAAGAAQQRRPPGKLGNGTALGFDSFRSGAARAPGPAHRPCATWAPLLLRRFRASLARRSGLRLTQLSPHTGLRCVVSPRCGNPCSKAAGLWGLLWGEARAERRCYGVMPRLCSVQSASSWHVFLPSGARAPSGRRLRGWARASGQLRRCQGGRGDGRRKSCQESTSRSADLDGAGSRCSPACELCELEPAHFVGDSPIRAPGSSCRTRHIETAVVGRHPVRGLECGGHVGSAALPHAPTSGAASTRPAPERRPSGGARAEPQWWRPSGA